MNVELLITYLHDHRAGATAATDVIERLIDENRGQALGEFASVLLSEIEHDEAELEGLIERYDAQPGAVKQAVAWAASKLTSPKLGRSISGDFGNFQALEFLSIGVLGKRALWRMLQSLNDPRLLSLDYGRLIERADSQFERIEMWRIRIGNEVMSQKEAV